MLQKRKGGGNEVGTTKESDKKVAGKRKREKREPG